MQNYIIQNNSFTMDTREARKSRLFTLSNRIEEFASELTLDTDELTWAIDAYSIYQTALMNQSIELAQKNEYSRVSQAADTQLFERYVILKELLMSRISNSEEILSRYGINEPVPYNRKDRYVKANQFLEANDYYLTEDSKFVLPQLMIDNLRTLLEDSFSKYNESESRKENSMDRTIILNDIFNDDSAKLRNLYNWVVAFWGKRDTRLYDLGFVPVKSARIGENLSNIFINYSKDEKMLTWNKIRNISVYQLAMRDKDTASEWIELFLGEQNQYKVSSLVAENSFKLRVKNDFGFSDWSPEMIINI